MLWRVPARGRSRQSATHCESRAVRPTSTLALAVFALLAVDAAGCIACGFTVTGLLPVVSKIVLLIALSVVYFRFRGDDRSREMAIYVLLWIIFSVAAAVLTYLCASWSLPVRDNIMVAFDRFLHFNLHSVTLVLLSHHVLYFVLKVLYASIVVQIAASVLLFAHLRAPQHNARLLASSIISLLAAAVISGLLPMLGPVPSEDPALATVVVRDVLAMRAGGPVIRNIADLQGIIWFPSYHAVLGILIPWAHRGLPTFWAVALLNGLMMFSIPSVGNHYVTDVLGGLALAAASIAATNLWLARAAHGQTRIGQVPTFLSSDAGPTSH